MLELGILFSSFPNFPLAYGWLLVEDQGLKTWS
jgi:hypothetical protein